jgi:hypothetical protein
MDITCFSSRERLVAFFLMSNIPLHFCVPSRIIHIAALLVTKRMCINFYEVFGVVDIQCGAGALGRSGVCVRAVEGSGTAAGCERTS